MRTIKDLTAQEFYDLKKSVMAPVYDDHGVSAPAGVDLSDNWMAPKGVNMPLATVEVGERDPNAKSRDTIHEELGNRLMAATFEHEDCPSWLHGGSYRVQSGLANILGVMAYFLSDVVIHASDVTIHPDFEPRAAVVITAKYGQMALIATFRLDGGASLELVEGSPRVVVQKFEVGL